MKSILPEGALAQHLAVLGKTGSGKSSVLRLLVERLLDAGKPVCIIDPKGDWWGLKSSADGKRAGYPVIIFGGEHADIPLNAHAGAHVAELVATGNRPCIIDLGGWMVSDRTRFFIDFASTLFRHSRGPRYLFIDEVHNFAPQGKVLDPDAGKMLHWANRLASEGRGKGITLMSASQRPQKVHKDFLTCAETLIAMRVIHPLDRNAIRDWIDGCPDAEKGREVLGSLAQMPRGTGWVWSPEIKFGPVRIEFPKFSTYDSFAAPIGDSTEKLKGWAEVNLEDVKAKLSTVVQEAARNDPKALRARIAELEHAARAQRPAVDQEALSKACEAARNDGYSRGRAETLHSIGQLVSMSERHATELLANLRAIESSMREAKGAPPASENHKNAAPRPLQRQATKAPPAARAALPASSTPSHGQNSGSPEVSRPQQRILNALAWAQGVRMPMVDKTQLALLSDQSPTSGGYFNNLGKLRSSGFIEYPTSGQVALTDAGRAVADAVDVPGTSAELQDQVMNRLPQPQARILRKLIHIYPGEINKNDLAEATDQSPTSGGYFNNLGRLRTLGLIDYPKPGKVVAQPVLFLE